MKQQSLWFWQPKLDFLKLFYRLPFGTYLVIFLNYSIWVYLFYIAYLLIRHDTNVFWQILLATVAGETVEKIGKSYKFWCRPLYERHDPTPKGLVDRWYKTGSFPSGHTIKSVFFLLFIIQYGVYSPWWFLAIIIPLLTFRVLIGFHYPIDMAAGIVLGAVIWLLTRTVAFPPALTSVIRDIFNFVFRIPN